MESVFQLHTPLTFVDTSSPFTSGPLRRDAESRTSQDPRSAAGSSVQSDCATSRFKVRWSGEPRHKKTTAVNRPVRPAQVGVTNSPGYVQWQHPSNCPVSYIPSATIPAYPPSTDHSKKPASNVPPQASSFTSQPVPQSASPKVLGKRKADALAEPPLPQLPSISPCTEYQSRSDMYTELSGRMRDYFKSCTPFSSCGPDYVNFHGSYSIVVDSSASNQKQATLISQDLQRIVKLPHRTDHSQKVNNHVEMYMVTCHCDCRKATTPNPPPHLPAPAVRPLAPPEPISTTLSPATFSTPGTPPPPKSTSHQKPVPAKQTSLSSWILRAGKKKEEPILSLSPAPAQSNTPVYAAPEIPEPRCGGTVRIAVMEDKSHPFFLGQRIVVEVLHPASP